MNATDRDATRIAFDEMPWQTSPSGVQFKVRALGGQQRGMAWPSPQARQTSTAPER